MSKVIVLDPGHGGTTTVGGSSPNNAVAHPSGVLEKTMTLDIAKRIRAVINSKAPEVEVILTRTGDTNVGIRDRAQVSASNEADLFLSIHFNAFNRSARGVETWIRAATNGNINLEADKAFAQSIQGAVLTAFRGHDPQTPDRGVKTDDERESPLGVLNDVSLGNTSSGAHISRACLVEIEFIDNSKVDALLNTGANHEAVGDDIAGAIADALLRELDVNFDPNAVVNHAGSGGGGGPEDGAVTTQSDYRLPVWADLSFPKFPWDSATCIKEANRFEGLVHNSFHSFAPPNGIKAVYYEAKFAVDADGRGPVFPGDTQDDNTNLHEIVNNKEVPLDATKCPFIVIPLPPDGPFTQKLGLKLGDLGICLYKNGKSVAVLYGDFGPSTRLGEGSIFACEKLGISGNPISGGIDAGEIGINSPAHRGIVHIVFPGSGDDKTTLTGDGRSGVTKHTPESIDQKARALLSQLVAT